MSTRPGPGANALTDPARLGPALAAATGDDRWLDHQARLIEGGRSNLTFELTCTAGALILRRPPTGDLLPSAHDMGREARIQRALADTLVPVPRIVYEDTTAAMLGVPFYVMEKVRGPVVRGELPAGSSATDGRAIADALVDTLVALHRVDPVAIGLGDFGRPAGYLRRQLRRWSEQWRLSSDHDVPELTRLCDLLAGRLPAEERGAVVHGDFRLDNCVLHPQDPGRIAAVLDWELATLGDPLTDLGMLLFYWREAGEPEQPLVQTVSHLPGFPPRRHLAERYADATGVSLDEIAFYQAFAHFKFAVIAQGVTARVAGGAMAGQDFGDLVPLVERCARTGLSILEQEG